MPPEILALIDNPLLLIAVLAGQAERCRSILSYLIIDGPMITSPSV